MLTQSFSQSTMTEMLFVKYCCCGIFCSCINELLHVFSMDFLPLDAIHSDATTIVMWL